MSFHLPKKYKENPIPAYYLDDVPAARNMVFQPDVYAIAELLVEASGAKGIVDLGPGYGGKLTVLNGRHPEWSFVGVDYGQNIAFCRTLPFGEWIEQDFEEPFDVDASGSVLVCSDVIEHLKDPTNLLRAIAGSKAVYVVVSTPERNVEHGWGSLGPPPNPCHVREWTAGELNALLSDHGITPRFHGMTRGNDQGWAMGTQVVLAEVAR